MSYLPYSAYILNILYIVLLELVSNELIKYLPITNPGFADSKPPAGFMVRSFKRVPGTPMDLDVNIKLPPWK